MTLKIYKKLYFILLIKMALFWKLKCVESIYFFFFPRQYINLVQNISYLTEIKNCVKRHILFNIFFVILDAKNLVAQIYYC